MLCDTFSSWGSSLQYSLIIQHQITTTVASRHFLLQAKHTTEKNKKIFVLVYGLCVKMCKNYNVDFFFNTWKILKSQKYHVARDWSYVVLCLLNTLALGRLNHLRSKPLSVMTPTITLWTLNLCNQNISFLFLLNFSPRLAIGQHRK